MTLRNMFVSKLGIVFLAIHETATALLYVDTVYSIDASCSGLTDYAQTVQISSLILTFGDLILPFYTLKYYILFHNVDKKCILISLH